MGVLMKITDLTAESINHIVDNLWERGRRELMAFGTTTEEFRAYCMSMIGKPWTAIFCDDDMTPCVMVILQPLGDMKWDIVSQATEEGFAKIWRPMARFFKQFSDKILQDCFLHGLAWEFQGRSVQTHERTPEWMDMLGFKLVSVEGDNKTYIKKAVSV
jgi:hypothetical protein